MKIPALILFALSMQLGFASDKTQLLKEAQEYFAQGRLEMTVKRCNQALEIEPQSSVAKSLRFQAEHVRQMEMEERPDTDTKGSHFGTAKPITPQQMKLIQEAFSAYNERIAQILREEK